MTTACIFEGTWLRDGSCYGGFDLSKMTEMGQAKKVNPETALNLLKSRGKTALFSKIKNGHFVVLEVSILETFAVGLDEFDNWLTLHLLNELKHY